VPNTLMLRKFDPSGIRLWTTEYWPGVALSWLDAQVSAEGTIDVAGYTTQPAQDYFAEFSQSGNLLYEQGYFQEAVSPTVSLLRESATQKLLVGSVRRTDAPVNDDIFVHRIP
jgi:hypothetical protein